MEPVSYTHLSPVIARWRSEREGTEETYDGIVGTSIARLTHRYDDFPRYEVSTLLERERSIQEISGQIQDYALPFFARFSNLPKLLDDVEQEGFFPPRKGFDVPKRNREFSECFREYLQTVSYTHLDVYKRQAQNRRML